MSTRVYISGFGIISALGSDATSNLAALKSGSTGIAPPKVLDTKYKEQLVVGEVNASNEELADAVGGGLSANSSRTVLLGIKAAGEAIAMAGLEGGDLQRAGFVNGTTVGGMDVSERYYKAYKQGEALNFHHAFANHDCGRNTGLIVDHFGMKGYSGTISTACSSSANAIMQAARLIRSGRAECVVAGGTDPLSRFTLNGFNALKILDYGLCKPFDINRAGLNLGEGAAFLVLESEKSVLRRGGKAYAQLIGYGNANDAYHQTASSPEGKGAILAMQKAIKTTGKKDLKIDCINAHGTGTVNNDLSESMAIKSVFGQSVPYYSSTKPYTGHTLAAAGAIEAVFSLFSIRHNLIFPSLHIQNPMDLLDKKPVVALKTKDQINCVLSNSFGFGGNCTSLIFSN